MQLNLYNYNNKDAIAIESVYGLDLSETPKMEKARKILPPMQTNAILPDVMTPFTFNMTKRRSDGQPRVHKKNSKAVGDLCLARSRSTG